MAGEQNHSPTIFLVDDEPSLLRLAVRVLEAEGHRILTATRADEALRAFEECWEQIDAVILDVKIPPHGVGELLATILDRRRDMPVILTSGDDLDAALRQQLRECGGEFLRKPFLPRQLLGIVDAAARGAKRAGSG